jgi:hypothetical protein
MTDPTNPTDQAYLDQLDEIRARRAALADAAAKRQEPTDAELLERERKALADDEAYEAAQREFGARAVRIVRTDEGAVVVRRPHIAAFRKFQDNGEFTSDVTEEFVRASLVYPSKPELEKILRLQPAALTRIASVCVELAGFRASELKAK